VEEAVCSLRILSEKKVAKTSVTVIDKKQLKEEEE